MDALVASLQGVAQVVTVVGMGALLAWQGALADKAFVSKLAQLDFDWMLPALQWSAILGSLTLSELEQFWPCAVFAVLWPALGAGIARLAIAIWPCSPVWQQQHIRAVVLASAFANSGYLPFVLVPAVIRSSSVFDDDPDAPDKGTAFIAVYVTVLSVLLWTFGFSYMGLATTTAEAPSEAAERVTELEVVSAAARDAGASGAGEAASAGSGSCLGGWAQTGAETAGSPAGMLARANSSCGTEDSGSPAQCRRAAGLEECRALTAADRSRNDSAKIEERSPQHLAEASIADAKDMGKGPGSISTGALWREPLGQDNDGRGIARRGEAEAAANGQKEGSSSGQSLAPDARLHAAELSCCWRLRQRLRRVAAAVVRHPSFNTPLIGCLLGFSMALIGPVRRVLVDDDAAMNWLFEAADLVGRAATPLAMMILGSQIQRNFTTARDDASSIPPFGVALASVTRLVLVPAAAVPITGLASRWGWFGEQPDGLLRLALLIEAACPAALNLVLMSMKVGWDATAVARMLFWQYLPGILTLTLAITWFLHVVEHDAILW